jgi:hypothetical protein
MASPAKKTNPKATPLDTIHPKPEGDKPGPARGLRVTVTIENTGRDREDEPGTPPDPQVVKSPIREDNATAALHLPTSFQLASDDGGQPKLTFSFTVSR